MKLIATNKELELRKKKEEITNSSDEYQNKPVISSITRHVQKTWLRVKEDNRYVREKMIDSLRRCRGEYSPEKLAAIRKFGGSEHYFRNIEVKCRAGESWIKDIYKYGQESPFVLKPTPIPDLPDEELEDKVEEEIQEKMQKYFLEVQAKQQIGEIINEQEINDTINNIRIRAIEEAKKEIYEEADKRASNMKHTIEDQNAEGGWDIAFKNFLWYLTRVKAGIIKGPIICKKKKKYWTMGEDGFIPEYRDELVPEVYCVSPFNFFPSKGITNSNDGDIIEIHELTRSAIENLKGVPGYSDNNIDRVLFEFDKGGLYNWLNIDDEQQVKEVEKDRDSAINTVIYDKARAIEYWGVVPGEYLIEWGMEGEIEPATLYNINAWLIGSYVIKAIINPDPIGNKPYSVTSWSKNPAWIWGEGLVELAEDIEEAMNAIIRAIINNVAIASGPQVEINSDRCKDNEPLYPWKRWNSTSSQMKEAPAVKFTDIPMHVTELVTAYRFLSGILDEHTVPAFAHGDLQVGGAGNTSSGLAQLIAAASRSIKAVVSNIDDDIIIPYIQRCYDLNMSYSTDNSIKGDIRIVAKGVQALAAKEQSATRKNEFLLALSNPTFAQLMGEEKVKYIIEDIAKSHDIIFPEDIEDKQEHNEFMVHISSMNNMAANATGQAAAGGSPTMSTPLNEMDEPIGSAELQRRV
jgi:hypothetical protein